MSDVDAMSDVELGMLFVVPLNARSIGEVWSTSPRFRTLAPGEIVLIVGANEHIETTVTPTYACLTANGFEKVRIPPVFMRRQQ